MGYQRPCALKSGPGIQLTIPSLPNPWLNRDTQERLSREAQDAIQQHTDPDLIDRASCLIEVLQHTRDSAEFLALEHAQQVKESEVQTDQGPVVFVREWIWFPMIYTREKRGHIIKWAPKYGLTGFLCPGKPGALCLEGIAQNVTVFINDIKTLSWADIPASHRKMTSRWQQRVTCESKQELEKQRLFNDMTEVTFELHGAFGNHNNLNMLSDWMKSKGCGDAFYHLFEYEDDGSKKA
ncbi:hypothetical protein CLU79DRAFT_778309 [Phycomyces nitens]|nr:hypothetical protein CLU79DRAFT_778309 [Phycomyces nitens]